jgi:hypothetical protein
MKQFRLPIAVAGTLLAAALLPPSAQSGVWDKKTIVKFPQAVEVPGAKLEAGTYVMKLHNSSSSRHIVEFWNERQDHLYSMAFAIPAQRLEPSDKTVLTFYEMPAGQPEALKTWFYPGDNVGQEFAYPKNQAAKISAVTDEQVPVAPAQVSDNKTAASDIEAVNGEPVVNNVEEPVLLAQNKQPASPAPAAPQDETRPAPIDRPEGAAPAPAPADRSEDAAPADRPQGAAPAAPSDERARNLDADAQSEGELPETASYAPIIGLLGFASAAGAFTVRKLRHKLERS